MTPETIAELRRLLDDVSARFASPRRGGKTYAREALAAAAVNALPALLDAADELLVCKTVARGHLEHAERRADERDALAADADKWQRAALTLQGDRDALTDERDSLSWQVEALRAERDARSAERDALAAKVERLLTLVSELADDEPCSFDHNGGCQTHGFLTLRPGETCPHHDAAELRAALDEEPQP